MTLQSAPQESVDWLTPGATLLAVMIGGLITWAIQVGLARREAKHSARAAARVLRVELAAASSRLKEMVENDPRWFPYGRVSLLSWDSSCTNLARYLSSHAWDDVAQAAVELRELDAGMMQAFGRGGPMEGKRFIELTDKQIAGIDSVWTSATTAYNALAPFARGDIVEGKLHQGMPTFSDTYGKEHGSAAW